MNRSALPCECLAEALIPDAEATSSASTGPTTCCTCCPECCWIGVAVAADKARPTASVW